MPKHIPRVLHVSDDFFILLPIIIIYRNILCRFLYFGIVYKHAGIKDVNNVLGTSTLTELGLDSLLGTDIKQVLEQDFNIELSAKEIRELTFDTIRELGSN